ncbi:hypothetical protein L7F22_034235 [Adiantum nelumboides]|nr:hypothetical protein [Adiantum nelumboides]
MEAAKLETYQNLVRVTQDLLEKQKLKPRIMPKPKELVVETPKEEIEVVEEPHLEVKQPEFIVPSSEGAINGVEEYWPRHLCQELVVVGTQLLKLGEGDGFLASQECEEENKTDAEIVIITIYVDDLIIGGDALEDVEHVKALLGKQFDMRDLGELRYFLGIEMIHNEGGVWLSQKKYGLDMLMKYGMADCKPISTPLDQIFKLRIDEGEVLDDNTMYTGTGTWLHGSDWPGSVFYRQSTSGYMFSFGSVAVTWSSKKQPIVALSSTEVEYSGATTAACEVAWLKMLLQDLEIQVQDSIVIYCDNINSIQLAQSPVFHACTKHIEVHYHFIRERVLDGDINLDYVGTKDQAADLFTKALGAENLQSFRGMLGLQDMALSLRRSVEISSSMHT